MKATNIYEYLFLASLIINVILVLKVFILRFSNKNKEDVIMNLQSFINGLTSGSK